MLTATRRALLVAALVLVLALFALDRYAAFVHVPASDSTRVVIYTTTWCPYCKQLHADPTSRVPYVEHDVQQTLQGQLGMWALRGRGMPVSVIGAHVVYGYRVDHVTPALQTLGYSLRAGGAAAGASVLR